MTLPTKGYDETELLTFEQRVATYRNLCQCVAESVAVDIRRLEARRGNAESVASGCGAGLLKPIAAPVPDVRGNHDADVRAARGGEKSLGGLEHVLAGDC